ncbi:unnamed protein product [Gemmata massiliana]|uniref:Uncharacterized protein n=1 Tax=Gemmata massiliana TaxID=1210884 RepID=A0A6P2DDB6_9BACT|nr:unnamed protein product [Gemmata massiliana]
MVRIGDVYLIPLLPSKQAVATVLGLGIPTWNLLSQVMLIGVYDYLIEGTPPTDLPERLVRPYWCICSFVEEGKWSLIQRGTLAASTGPSSIDSVWATHELFLDDLRQRLGLERQTYTGAEFTFSTHCRECEAVLHQGFARCPKCRAIREEFRGLEQFVADRVGCCCLSGARSDVRDSDGSYYWAPYFIDRVRAGSSGGPPDAEPGGKMPTDLC